MSEGPRVGVLGCGSIARAHLSNLAALDLGRPWAYADVRRSAAEEYLERFGGSYATDDPEKLLADPQVDVVIVATPDRLHAAQALQVLSAGKHLFLEKPMATNLADALRVQRAAAASDRTFMVDLKFRFAPAIVAAQSFVTRPLVVFGQSMGDPEPEGH